MENDEDSPPESTSRDHPPGPSIIIISGRDKTWLKEQAERRRRERSP